MQPSRTSEGNWPILLDLKDSSDRNWNKNDLPGRERCRIGRKISWQVVLLFLPCSFSCCPSSSPLAPWASWEPSASSASSASSTTLVSSASFDALPMTLSIGVVWSGSSLPRRSFTTLFPLGFKFFYQSMHKLLGFSETLIRA